MFPGSGGRPPLDMGFGGGRFMGPGSHMGDGGDGYLGPGRGAGWHGHGEVDDGRGPPLMGPSDVWDGLGPHGDERLRHGRMDWERGPMGIRAWERDRERAMWEERARDGPAEFIPHRGQMDLHPQNHVYPVAGAVWGAPRDPQVSSEGRPRQERPLFVETQDMKRKHDEETMKRHLVKASGGRDGIFPSGGRLSKFAASTRQSILSQLDISADLAGKELYEEYCSLLPVSLAAKADVSPGEESPLSEPADDDLDLEADTEAETLIKSPNLLATLLPPLPDGVFEEALRLYMKAETENRLLKSLRGSFALPFDPSTITEPTLSGGMNGMPPGSCLIESLSGSRGGFPNHLRDAIAGQGRGEPSVGDVNPVDAQEGRSQDGHAIADLQVEEVNEGDFAAEDFHSLHVEVAEYSDREFEAEMEDPLEEENAKDVLPSGTSRSSGGVEGVTDDDNLKAGASVQTDSIDPVNIMDEKKEIVGETDTDWPADVQGVEDVIPEITSVSDHIMDGIGAEADPGETETVNNFVVIKTDEPNDSSLLQAENVGVEKEEAANVESSVGVGELSTSHVSIADIPESQELQFSLETQGDLLAVASEFETVNAPDVSEVQIQEFKDLHFAPETEEPLPVPAKPEAETIGVSDVSQAELLESQGVQSIEETQDEAPFPVASMPGKIFNALGDNFEDVEAELGPNFVDVLTIAKDVDKVTVHEEDSFDPKFVESVGEDVLQDTADFVAVGDETEEDQSKVEDAAAVPILEDGRTAKQNVKQKHVAEEVSAPDPMEMDRSKQEPTTRAEGRRSSSRLRAQQALEKQALAQAQAAADQESLDSFLDQSLKKSSRGKAKSSQRKSKRRGSTR